MDIECLQEYVTYSKCSMNNSCDKHLSILIFTPQISTQNRFIGEDLRSKFEIPNLISLPCFWPWFILLCDICTYSLFTACVLIPSRRP